MMREEPNQFVKGELAQRRKPTQLSLEVIQHKTKVSHMETTSYRKVLNDEQPPGNQAIATIRNIPSNGENNVFQRRSNDQGSKSTLNEELNSHSQKASNVIPKQVALLDEESNVQPKSMSRWKANIDSKSKPDALLHVANIKASQEPNNIVINKGHGIFSKTRPNMVLKQTKKVNDFNNSMVLPIRETIEQGFNAINAQFNEHGVIMEQQLKNVDKYKSLDDLHTYGRAIVNGKFHQAEKTLNSKFHQAEKTLHHYCGDDLYTTTKLNFNKKFSLLTRVHLLVILNSPYWEVSSQ